MIPIYSNIDVSSIDGSLLQVFWGKTRWVYGQSSPVWLWM